MKKNNVKQDSREFSFINFYKNMNNLNNLSIKNKIGKDLNKKILSDITQMNFSFKKLNNNNDINMIEPKKKFKFKTTKNTPNSSLKNIKLNYVEKDMKIKKEIFQKDFKNKELFDDGYIKKIKQVYNNRMKINNNFINNFHQKRSNSNNLFNDISKSKIKKQNTTIAKKFYKLDFKENNNLNMTNYLTKSRENNQHIILSNENNLYNNNDDGIVFTNNGKDNINDNIMLSSNYSKLSNTNINNNLKDKNRNRILLKFMENKYNNIIRNKIKQKKFLINNMRNNNDSIKLYLKNNFSFNEKAENNYKRRINRINNKILNSKELQISDKSYMKSFTPINSNDNSLSKPLNLKIKKGNKIFDNIGNNLFTQKMNYFSTKNSTQNLLRLDDPRNNLNNEQIKRRYDEDNYTNKNNYISDENKNPKTHNNYNININNYNNIKIINDKNIKDGNNDKNKKNDSIKKILKDIILYIPNNNNNEDNTNLISSNINNNKLNKEKLEKDKNIISKENDNKITFISINNNMNITNQNQFINNYAIQLKSKEKIKNKENIIEKDKIFKNSNDLENNYILLHKENSNLNPEKKSPEKKRDYSIEMDLIDNQKEKIKSEEKVSDDFDEKELLCNINKGKDNLKDDEDNKSNTSQSRDCLYYQNELDKLSSYIKKYYSEKMCYPESNVQFYLFGREIGHGAFGKVNLCLHIGSGHLVAMKTFVKKDSKYKESKEKLKNEVEVLSKLHHPFINQILDNFETDTHFFIVMEYVCGDLLSFIRKRNKLSESIAQIIFKQLIEGLKYIHKKNIIHRDIKLDNILIDTTNTVKICDFGVSRKINKGEKIYERCGTPAYIAPEIYKKIGYTGFQSDIWSAGVTLYYILSGNLPFKGNNIHELENNILFGEYKKIKGVSYEANDIIDKMLRQDPSERINIEGILKHPWLKNVNLENRYKLNIFTKAEKKVLAKYYVDYLNSSKNDLIENFTYRNLTIDKNQKKLSGNTKSVIYAPYNTCVNENEEFLRTKRGKVDKSYLSKEEAMLYNELEIKNDICKFGWRVRQANMNYELSNNDDFDNGLIKSESNHYNKNTEENSINNDKTIESIKDYEKIQIDDNILKFIENKIGYDQKYMIKNLKKNAINYATATYYLKYKELSNENVTVEEDEFF